MKILLFGAKVFPADGRTDGHADMTKLTVAFRKFANATEDVTAQILHTDIYEDRWLLFSWDTDLVSEGSHCSFLSPEVTYFALCPSIWL